MTNSKPRLTHSLALKPLAGGIFQPTGFPDIGAATFERWNSQKDGWENALLLESAQSMANRLEAVGLDAKNQPAGPVAHLPFVQVVDDNDEVLTNSRFEPHRLASAYIRHGYIGDDKVIDVLEERLNLVQGHPLDSQHVVKKLFALDPLSVLHGVFFAVSEWPFQPKIQRAVTCIVEAVDVKSVDSGGVKTDPVYHSLAGADISSKGGYGMIPHHRQEFAAREILLHWTLDQHLLRNCGLSKEASDLLIAVAKWQLLEVLDSGLRFRTACDLELVADGPNLGSTAGELKSEIEQLASKCPELKDSETPLTVSWTIEKAKEAKE